MTQVKKVSWRMLKSEKIIWESLMEFGRLGTMMTMTTMTKKVREYSMNHPLRDQQHMDLSARFPTLRLPACRFFCCRQANQGATLTALFAYSSIHNLL